MDFPNPGFRDLLADADRAEAIDGHDARLRA